MNSTPFVVAGCPAKNRAWALPRWYAALMAQPQLWRKPDAVFVLLNDSDDDSEILLNEMSVASSWLRDTPHLSYGVVNTGDPGYDRIYPRYSTANLATVRNYWIERALHRWPELTHLWSCDSDVLPDADVLEKLLASDKPVIAAVVANHATGSVFNYFTGEDADGPRRHGLDSILWSMAEVPFEVTMTGACVLIRRDVLDAGVRYADHARGEDVAWSKAASEAGFPLYVHPKALTSHLQKDNTVWR